jgi:hypothetical protein
MASGGCRSTSGVLIGPGLRTLERMRRSFSSMGKFADAGIGDQDVDFSLRLHDLVEAIEVLQFRNVPANACDVAADRLHGLIERLLTAPRYEDKGAFVDEALRRGETYSRGATGNHGEVSLQLAHSRHSFGFGHQGCRTRQPVA